MQYAVCMNLSKSISDEPTSCVKRHEQRSLPSDEELVSGVCKAPSSRVRSVGVSRGGRQAVAVSTRLVRWRLHTSVKCTTPFDLFGRSHGLPDREWCDPRLNAFLRKGLRKFLPSFLRAAGRLLIVTSKPSEHLTWFAQNSVLGGYPNLSIYGIIWHILPTFDPNGCQYPSLMGRV